MWEAKSNGSHSRTSHLTKRYYSRYRFPLKTDQKYQVAITKVSNYNFKYVNTFYSCVNIGQAQAKSIFRIIFLGEKLVN